MFYKTTSLIIPKNILIKIKYLGLNNFIIRFFGPLSVIKLKIVAVSSLVRYYDLLLITFCRSKGDILRKEIAYYESVAHILKFSFINVIKSYSCFMRIKGVGFKLEHVKANIVQATLGFSHKIIINIPNFIRLCVLKKRIVIWSYSLMKLQQFCFFLTRLREKDSYNGKGIFQPHLQKRLKIGKISRI